MIYLDLLNILIYVNRLFTIYNFTQIYFKYLNNLILSSFF